MPFSVHIDNVKKTINLVCWSDITIDDMMEYERRFWGGPEHNGFHHVVDLQAANLKISLDESLMLVTHVIPTDLNAYSGARSALIVSDEEQQFLAEAYRDARHQMCNPQIRR